MRSVMRTYHFLLTQTAVFIHISHIQARIKCLSTSHPYPIPSTSHLIPSISHSHPIHIPSTSHLYPIPSTSPPYPIHIPSISHPIHILFASHPIHISSHLILHGPSNVPLYTGSRGEFDLIGTWAVWVMEKRCSAMRRHSGWMELNPSFLIEAIILFRGCPIFTRLSRPLGLGLGRTRSARARALSPSDADRENISTFIFFPFCLFFWVFFPEEGDHFIIRIYSLSEKKSLRDFSPFRFHIWGKSRGKTSFIRNANIREL